MMPISWGVGQQKWSGKLQGCVSGGCILAVCSSHRGRLTFVLDWSCVSWYGGNDRIDDRAPLSPVKASHGVTDSEKLCDLQIETGDGPGSVAKGLPDRESWNPGRLADLE
jgi:hypothetical protein